MKVPNLVSGLVIGILILGFAPELSSQTLQKKQDEKSQAVEVKLAYSCPMHPEVISDKPGKCSRCGMDLVVTETAKPTEGQTGTASEKIGEARVLLTEAKLLLVGEGKYGCCIKEACDECALAHQNCPCAKNLKAGKDVCSQCFGGWQRGEGVIEGVKAKDVKLGHGYKH